MQCSTDTIPPGYLLHTFTFSRFASATTICSSRKKVAPKPKLFSLSSKGKAKMVMEMFCQKKVEVLSPQNIGMVFPKIEMICPQNIDGLSTDDRNGLSTEDRCNG